MSKVYIDFNRTGNVGIICIDVRDIQLAKKIDLYSTIAWHISGDNYLAGWEYFMFFADKLKLKYRSVFEDELLHGISHQGKSSVKHDIIDADSIPMDVLFVYEIEFRRLMHEFENS